MPETANFKVLTELDVITQYPISRTSLWKAREDGRLSYCRAASDARLSTCLNIWKRFSKAANLSPNPSPNASIADNSS